MKLPAFDYACPATLSEAVALLAAHDGEARPLAGGQSLIPMMAFRIASPKLLVDLRYVPDLRTIRISDDGVRLGAMVRWRDILDDRRLATANPLLVATVAEIAHHQIRNRGTVGGSLAHADPAAELPGVAIACDAEITAVGKAGARIIKASEFFVGALTTTLETDEVITEVHFPAWPANRRYAFQEFSLRRGDFALSGVALYYDLDGDGKAADASVGVIGVADRPLRLAAVEAVLNGRAIDDAAIAASREAACAAVDPHDDIHASAAYRRSLTGTMVERALTSASR
jgi:carbon-monoxide dehydrogenase medium subunit